MFKINKIRASPLFQASQNGHLDIVKVLIEADGDVNQASNDKYTALGISSQFGNLEIVRLLLHQPWRIISQNV